MTRAVPDTTHVQVQKMPCASLMAHGWTIASSGQTGTLDLRKDDSTAAANLEDRLGFRLDCFEYLYEHVIISLWMLTGLIC